MSYRDSYLSLDPTNTDSLERAKSHEDFRSGSTRDREKDYQEKEEVETLDRLVVLQLALSTDAELGGIFCGMRRSSPRGSVQCVRPRSSASMHRVGQSDLSPSDTYHRNELHSSSARGAPTRLVEPVAPSNNWRRNKVLGVHHPRREPARSRADVLRVIQQHHNRAAKGHIAP